MAAKPRSSKIRDLRGDRRSLLEIFPADATKSAGRAAQERIDPYFRSRQLLLEQPAGRIEARDVVRAVDKRHGLSAGAFARLEGNWLPHPLECGGRGWCGLGRRQSIRPEPLVHRPFVVAGASHLVGWRDEVEILRQFAVWGEPCRSLDFLVMER